MSTNIYIYFVPFFSKLMDFFSTFRITHMWMIFPIQIPERIKKPFRHFDFKRSWDWKCRSKLKWCAAVTKRRLSPGFSMWFEALRIWCGVYITHIVAVWCCQRASGDCHIWTLGIYGIIYNFTCAMYITQLRAPKTMIYRSNHFFFSFYLLETIEHSIFLLRQGFYSNKFTFIWCGNFNCCNNTTSSQLTIFPFVFFCVSIFIFGSPLPNCYFSWQRFRRCIFFICLLCHSNWGFFAPGV